MTSDAPLALSDHPDAVYVVVARHGGPVRYSSWSHTFAVREKKKLQGDFVVVKYVAPPRVGETKTP
jgi:hypothetical protein